MPAEQRLIAGAMSGTSADGVDVAITRITGRGLAMQARLIVHHHADYRPELKQAIFALRSEGKVGLSELARLGREISLSYAGAVKEALNLAQLESKDIDAIAAHGQTLFHDPPNSIQWFDPALLAAETNCAVVSDFRRADLAAGGQGAPLVPFADYILFRDGDRNRVLLNLGGIANITYLKAGGKIEDVIAFDTGPGNCISDYLCRKYDPEGPGYDAGGELALRGDSRHDLVRFHFLDVAYFNRKPPKSTDGPEMIALFESLPPARQPHFGIRDRGPQKNLEDLLAMAALLTTLSVMNAINDFLPTPVDELVVSGGGIKNAAIMHFLDLSRGKMQLTTTDILQVPSDAKEAIAFALLGAATLDDIPSNVPSVTGAKRPVVLGSITPRP